MQDEDDNEALDQHARHNNEEESSSSEEPQDEGLRRPSKCHRGINRGGEAMDTDEDEDDIAYIYGASQGFDQDALPVMRMRK